MDELEKRLKELVEKNVYRSKIARLRGLLPLISKLLQMGFSHAEIVDELKKGGLEMTVPVFRQTLARIKKQIADDSYPRDGVELPASLPRVTPPATARKYPIQESQSEPEEQNESGGLSAKDRREKRADQYITPQSTNPLFDRLKDKK